MTITQVKGFRDIFYNQIDNINIIKKIFLKYAKSFGYKEILLPTVEKDKLFLNSIGKDSDILKKELFFCHDINRKKLFCLRPEGTASCLRAVFNNNIYYYENPKFFYIGSMFRYENPQKNRFREFIQFGIESYNRKSYLSECEHLLMFYKILKYFRLNKKVTLEINNIGTYEERIKYSKVLTQYLLSNKNILSIEEKEKISSNIFRILDKNQNITLLKNAPRIDKFVSEESKKNFSLICDFLRNNDINFIINPFLVRGIDYYNNVVYEWKCNSDTDSKTICAGGRYDYLINKIDEKKKYYPSCGFSIGVDRMAILLNSLPSTNYKNFKYDFSIVSDNINNSCMRDFNISNEIREKINNISIISDIKEGSLKSKIKKSKKFAKCTIVLLKNKWYYKNIEENFFSINKNTILLNIQKLLDNIFYGSNNIIDW